MSDSDKARIEELEREVSQLRSRLEEGDEAPSESETVAAEPEPEPEVTDDGNELAPPSNWPKIVVTSVVIVCIALGLMLAIFQALSAGIESMAPKAAGMFVPDTDKKAPAPTPTKKKTQDRLRAPGL